MLGAATVAFSGSSGAAVSAITGNGYGYKLSVGLFGGAPNIRGFEQENPTDESDSPSVALAADGSNSPQMASQPSVNATVGPAAFLVTGTQTVTSEGTTGATGSVTSTATIADISTATGGALTATTLSSECSTSAAGVPTGSATIAEGVLETDSGIDDNDDGDFDDPGEHAPVTEDLVAAPAPNTSFPGHIHVNGVQEDFVYLFNEQVTEGDNLTVYAAHQRIGITSINPDVPDADAIAKGDLFIGKVTCGLSGLPDGAVTTTTLPGQTTTSSSTSSTTPGSSTSSTMPGSSTSSTTPGSSTSSTVAATSTTRATGAGTRAATGSGGNLPRTGTGGFVLALLGLALLAAGAVTKVLGKKVS